MKYLFGDSTESPLKRDFLELLDYFLDTGIETVKLENTVFGLKDDIRERRRLKNSVLEEMDNFQATIDEAISGAVSKSNEKEKLSHYADKSKHFLEKFVIEGKREFSDDIHRELTEIDEKIKETNEANRLTLEPFFMKGPIPVTNKKYTLKATKEGYFAKVVVEYEGDISCVFGINTSSLEFWKKPVKGVDFLRGVSIPIKMKKPLLKKELEPDYVNIDYFNLTDLVLSGNRLEVVFRKSLNINSERFRLKMNLDGVEVDVYHAEENSVERNIKASPELKSALNTSKLCEMGEILDKMTTGLYTKRNRLEGVYLIGIDVIEETLIFDLMERLAEVFAPMVSEIEKHSPSDGELSLKVEDKTGKRGEIYLKKTQIREKLGAIEDKGSQILEILGID